MKKCQPGSGRSSGCLSENYSAGAASKLSIREPETNHLTCFLSRLERVGVQLLVALQSR